MIDGFGQSLGDEKLSLLSKILYKKINYDGVSVVVCTHARQKLSKIASVYVKLSFGKIVGIRSRKKQFDSNEFQNSINISNMSVHLPSSTGLKKTEINNIVVKIKKYLNI